MSIAPKASTLQAYTMSLYRAALHPEFFEIEGRRRIEHGDYEFESWIFPGGHALRFEFDALCVSEIVTDTPDRLPERSLVASLPCAGEKDHEAEFTERIMYMTSIQTEQLSDHLYLGTYKELVEHGRNGDCLLTLWTEEGKNSLSLLDLQRFRDEVHVQAYHLRGEGGLVLRTQSIFQIND